ncbi:hypothetical protein C8F04DRAFT_1222862 [Mycena alexandri]|uniref:Smr domain-containing protein n=1 Tax=Mycena alexandri TaxID=1745969 RepID=A0AAD6WYD4_9AGAR|nr:hypothetical protein C8F04DRAFT_1222862 [Mycena alexandri]
MDAIFESLQREFCPPLDSSLVAALLADIVVDSSSTDVSADPQIVALRSILIELAVHADEEAVPTEDDVYHDETTSGSSVPDFCTTTSASTTSASDLSGGSRRSAAALAASSFNSPLGFLQAALPHIPAERLRRAFASSSSADQDDDDTESELDMWELISALLSEETEKEMRERDLDEEELSALELAAAAPWETVETKRATGRKTKAKSKIKGKIALSDVRQQQHIASTNSNSFVRRRTTTDGLDPWAQLVSLSTHIARFLPPHPPAFFQSYFHMPQYAAPYDALCAALYSISGAAINSADDGDNLEHTATLFGLLDVLLPAYSSNSTSSTEALITDVHLALKAAQGRGEDAFELVRVLRDLDDDRESGVWGVGVYHSPVTSPSGSPFSEKSTPWGAATLNGGRGISRGASTSGTSTSRTLPAGPAPTPPPPNLLRSPPPGLTNKPKNDNAYQWQAVPPRRRATAPTIYPHAMRVPVYERDVNGVRVKANAGAGRVGAVVGAEGASDFRRRARESMRRRDELLREAARMWQRGNRRTMGGEVAWYFAERAREFQEVARREALDAARVMVSAKRPAVIIVNEILAEGGWSAERPLKIITGRGTHSAGRVSVLKPAVRKALEEEGWVVGGWEGGLSVRGRVGGRR